MPQLDPTWFASQIFWLFASFVLLYIVLSRFVLPPLQGIVNERQQTVNGDLDKAQSLKSQADQARQEYERMLAQARGRSQQLMTDALNEHKAKADLAGKEMDRQIELKLEDATRRIAAKKEELLQALTPTTADLASLIVEKIAQRSPGSDQVNRIVSGLFKQRG